jgi:hypothetical protein
MPWPIKIEIDDAGQIGTVAIMMTRRLIPGMRGDDKEHESILAILDDKQKQRLLALVGRRFDPTALGQVSFRAPDFSDGDEWINSAPLKLKDLQGKVVAIHFWAYG